MGKFSESNYNILNKYFNAINTPNIGSDGSYLIGPNKTIVAKSGLTTHLYEKKETGEFIGYKFKIYEISGNNFKFVYSGLVSDNSLSIGDFTVGSEMYFRKDSFFYDWLNVNKSIYRDDINTNKTFTYFGKIYEIDRTSGTYNIIFEGMKDFMINALPENNRNDKLNEFLTIYFDQVHHSVYNMTKNIWSLLDPKEIDIRFLNLIAIDYGIEIDENLSETRIRDWVDTIIYFLKRKGDYSSIYIIFKMLLGNTENKLNIYERWGEWYSNEISDIPVFNNDHHIIEHYGEQAEGGAGEDYYSKYDPLNYPVYTDANSIPSGNHLKDIWVCGDTQNYKDFSGTDTSGCVEVIDRSKIRIDNFNKSTDEVLYSLLNTTPSGDFYHCLKTKMSSAASLSSGLYIWGLGNENEVWNNCVNGWLGISFEWYDGSYQFKASEGYNSGFNIQSIYTSGIYSTEIEYYLGIKRNNENLVLSIFNNEERSNLLEMITLPLTGGNVDYNYLFALNSLTSSGYGKWSGDICDLSINAEETKGINLTNNLILTPHYNVELDLSTEPINDGYIINENSMKELVRYWNYTKPVSKYVKYEQLIAPTCKIDEAGVYNSLYNETKNEFLNTQFTGTLFLSGSSITPSGNNVGALTYTHKQLIFSKKWVVNHYMGTKDFVYQIYDHNKQLIKPDIIYINSENTITLEFNSSNKGELYIAGVRENFDYLHTEITMRPQPTISSVPHSSNTYILSDSTSGNTYIDIDIDSNPFISSYDNIEDKIRYSTLLSNNLTSDEIDSGGFNNIIKRDDSNISHMLYNNSNDDVIYSNNSTGSWVPVEVGSDGKDGVLSMAIDSLNNPHIIYLSEDLSNNKSLKYATKLGGLWNIETIDNTPSGNFQDISLITKDDYLHLSYSDIGNNIIKYSNNLNGSFQSIDTSASGRYTSIAIDSNNYIHISYKNSFNDYIHITNKTGNWVPFIIDSVSSDSIYFSMDIDNSDVLHTIYNDGSEIKYAEFNFASWIGWSNTVIEETLPIIKNMGFSLKIDNFDNIHISYSDGNSLKYIKNFQSIITNQVSFEWDIDHNLATSGASHGVISQFYNNKYYQNQIVPISQDPNESGNNITAVWNTPDAYRGTSPIRRADYKWDSVEESSYLWNFNTDLEGWTGTNADIYVNNEYMKMIPTNWSYGESAAPEIRKIDLDLNGADNAQITARVKVRDASNAWSGKLYWSTPLHEESELFYEEIRDEGDSNYNWKIIKWEMSSVPDWTENNISSIRMDMIHDDYTFNNGVLINTDNVNWDLEYPGKSYETDNSYCRIEGLNLSEFSTPNEQSIKITIDSSLIDEDLTNFPVMINVSTSAGKTNYDASKLFDVLDTDDKKTNIKITNINGTNEYFSEISANWDASNKKGIIWSKIPIISSTVDTEFLLSWYASGGGERVGIIGSNEAKNVWSDEFAGVWHMGQNPSGGIIKDSTINELHGIPSADASNDNFVDGLIGKAYEFKGTDNDLVNIGKDINLSFGHDTYDSAFSIELLEKSLSVGSNPIYENNSYLFDSRTSSGAYFRLFDSDGDSIESLTTSLSAYSGDWMHQMATYDGSGESSGLNIYIQGLNTVDSHFEIGDYDFMSSSLSGWGFTIGSDTYDTNQTIDEVRIHSTERSPAWTKASKHSQYDNLLTMSNAQERRKHILRLIDTNGLEASGWIGNIDDVLTTENNIILDSITKSSEGDPGIMTISSSANLSTGSMIKFNSLNEMTELNDKYSTVKFVSGNNYEILDTSGFNHAEITGGYCQKVIDVGTDGIHVYSSMTNDDQSWSKINNNFDWNDVSYTVLVTSTVVTGEFDFDWIMISNVPATWEINHNLNAGGLIIQCFDYNEKLLNPKKIILNDSNLANIYFNESTIGSASIIYLPKTFVIETTPDDITGLGISENLGHWEIGNGTQLGFNPIGANSIQSTFMRGNYSSVTENSSGTHYIVEFKITSNEDIEISEIGIFNELDNIMFYTLCSPIFKPANIDLKLYYRIEKNE